MFKHLSHSLFVKLAGLALPLGKKPVTIVFLLYGIYFLIDTLLRKRSKLAAGHQFIGILLLPLFFGVNLVSLLLSTNQEGIGSNIERRLSLVIIPLILTFFSHQIKSKGLVEEVGKYFVAGNVVAIALNVLIALSNSISFIDSELIFDASVLGGQSFFHSIVYGGNYFFYSDYSTFLHPTYWSLHLCFALCILNHWRKVNKEISKTALLILTGIFVLTIFQLSSRASIATLGLLVALFIVDYLRALGTRKRSTIVSLGLVVILAFVGLVSNPRFLTLFEKERWHIANNQRLQSWAGAIQIIKARPILGVGLNDTEKRLAQYYEENNYAANLALRANAHNQFLETFAATGVVGILILLLIFIYAFYIAHTNRNTLLFYFVLIFLVNCLFESMLNVFAGLTTFTFFYSVFMIFNASCASDPENEI